MSVDPPQPNVGSDDQSPRNARDAAKAKEDTSSGPSVPSTETLRGSHFNDYPRPTHEASVVLCMDTNVFVRHLYSIEHLESVGALEQLFSHCRIIIPEVVMKECERLYAEKATKLKGTRPPELKARLSELDHTIGELFERHFAAWRTKLGQIADIVPTSDELLRAAYDRLIAKKPPCHARDETRDAIIWETVLATLPQPHKNKMKVFVTDNTKDFPFESDPSLQDESTDAGVLWFKTFADLQRWLAPLRPTPWQTGVEFATWYEDQDFSWQTAGQLQDELYAHLMQHFEYFSWDSEVLDLERVDFDITSEPGAGETGLQFRVSEEWDISVSYSVGTDVRIGGCDGIDSSVSGWRQASGNATLTRTLTFDSENHLVANEIDIAEIKLCDDEDEWDPHEAWLDSLAEDRDDA